MQHSKVVGGSTAKRVIACPGSVALCAKMPPRPSSTYANEGTLLHSAMDAILSSDIVPQSVIGMTYEGEVLTRELYDEKIVFALNAIEEIDPNYEMEMRTESRVHFGELLPDVFGSTDLLGRIGNRAIVLDWKFGNGVPVPAEENSQGMFYAAAAMRTPETKHMFEGVDEVEIIIVQPPSINRWVTTPERIKAFELELVAAVKQAMKPDAPLQHGEHCRWCAAKPVCPKMTGAVDRALKVQLESLDVKHIDAYLKNADLLEQWITDLRALAFQMMDKGVKLPSWKLVQKRATRKWKDNSQAKEALLALGLTESDVTTTELLTPAQAEKVLKKHKLELPADQVVSVSSGTTLASVDDPRPEVLQIGQQLSAALSKLV